jgi:hypothetical protein
VINLKSDGNNLILPLQSGNQFVAKANDYTYILTRQFFTVIKDGKLIGKQPVFSYKENETKPISKTTTPSMGYSYGSMTIYRPNF